MEIKRNIRRKNRKIKFSEYKYVERYYLQEGKAVIPVELKEVSDLYMEHDYKKLELADSVCNYIEEIAYMIPVNTDIVLEIHCPKVDKFTQDRMSKSMILLVFGILLIIMNILTDRYINSSILSNFLCVVWWVAIWDMIEIQTMDKTENKWKRLNFQQLYDAEITFVFDEEKEEDN